jgi:hypothetical protein
MDDITTTAKPDELVISVDESQAGELLIPVAMIDHSQSPMATIRWLFSQTQQVYGHQAGLIYRAALTRRVWRAHHCLGLC